MYRFTLYFRAIFQVQPPRGLYLEWRFNGGFFCVTGLGGLFLEGLIFGILRYVKKARVSNRTCIWLALHYPFQALELRAHLLFWGSYFRIVLMSLSDTHGNLFVQAYVVMDLMLKYCWWNCDFTSCFITLFYNNLLIYKDVDECTSQTHNCPANGVCTNVEGSFQCECQSGFTGDGKTCDGRSRDTIVAYLLSLCLFLNLNLNMVSSATRSARDITQTLKH